MKKGGNFGSKEEVFFNSTSNSNYKDIIHTQNWHKVKFKPKTKPFPWNPHGCLSGKKTKMEYKRGKRGVYHTKEQPMDTKI